MYHKNAYEAYQAGHTYRPSVWGVGIHALHPREAGVELLDRRVILDGVTIKDEGSELILFKYRMTSNSAKVRKEAVARKPCTDPDAIEPFWTTIPWVESRKKV